MTDLTLLHTSPVHIATFDRLRDRLAPGANLAHIVREDLLSRAREHGVEGSVTQDTVALIGKADGPVLCTCTTLGEVAEKAGAIRIDRPMMQAAARTGGHVLLAYCLESTARPSRLLLEEEMANAANGNGITPLFIASAWPRFEAGDRPGFSTEIAGAIRQNLASGTTCIVLAQASMADAAEHLADLPVPVLASPEPALRAGLGLSAGDR